MGGEAYELEGGGGGGARGAGGGGGSLPVVVEGTVVTATALGGRESVSGRVLAGAPIAGSPWNAGYGGGGGGEMETFHNGLETADATFEPASSRSSRRKVRCSLAALFFVLVIALLASTDHTHAEDGGDGGSPPVQLTESGEVDVSSARGPVVAESQPVQVPVPAVMQSQSVDMVLQLSISDIEASAGGRDAFETTFTESTAAALSVPRSRVCCVELRGGSTVATFTLLVAPDPAAISPLDLVTQLQSIVTNQGPASGGAAALALLEMVDTTVPVTAAAAPATPEVTAALETRMQHDVNPQTLCRCLRCLLRPFSDRLLVITDRSAAGCRSC